MRKKVYKNSIKHFREAKRWRQLDLARRLHVYQSEVSEIERGEREPGVYLALRIAKVLGTLTEEIF